MQPITRASDGVIRFRGNAIVEWLVDTGRVNLNEIASHGFPQADMEQFWQLLGYSVSGYGDLSFISPETVQAADELANRISDKPDEHRS